MLTSDWSSVPARNQQPVPATTVSPVLGVNNPAVVYRETQSPEVSLDYLIFKTYFNEL